MRILVVGPVPPEVGGRNTGGIARHVWGLANALITEGHQVDLLPMGLYFHRSKRVQGIWLGGWPPHLKEILKAPPLAAKILVRWGLTSGPKEILHAIHAALRVSRIDGKLNDYDVVHVHGVHNGALVAFRLANTGAPLLVTLHSNTDILLHSGASDKRLRFVQRNIDLADGVVHVSTSARAQGQSSGLAFNGLHFVVHNGVNCARVSTGRARSGFCFVGGLQQIKRIDLLVEARRYVGDGDQPLVVAGDGPQRWIVKQAQRSGEPVVYHGSVRNEVARHIMNEALVLTVPSISESFGLVYVEALMEGTAVIGFGPIIEELQNVLEVSEDEARLLVPLPVEELSAIKLAELMESTAKWRDSAEGRTAMKRLSGRTCQQFGWPVISRRMTEVYERVIGR